MINVMQFLTMHHYNTLQIIIAKNEMLRKYYVSPALCQLISTKIFLRCWLCSSYFKCRPLFWKLPGPTPTTAVGLCSLPSFVRYVAVSKVVLVRIFPELPALAGLEIGMNPEAPALASSSSSVSPSSFSSSSESESSSSSSSSSPSPPSLLVSDDESPSTSGSSVSSEPLTTSSSSDSSLRSSRAVEAMRFALVRTLFLFGRDSY